MTKELLLRLCGKNELGRLIFGDYDCSQRSQFTFYKKPALDFSRRALIDLTGLEFKTQIRLEYLILIHRIDTDVVPNSAGAD